jgi:hypothetical protein
VIAATPVGPAEFTPRLNTSMFFNLKPLVFASDRTQHLTTASARKQLLARNAVVVMNPPGHGTFPALLRAKTPSEGNK